MENCNTGFNYGKQEVRRCFFKTRVMKMARPALWKSEVNVRNEEMVEEPWTMEEVRTSLKVNAYVDWFSGAPCRFTSHPKNTGLAQFFPPKQKGFRLVSFVQCHCPSTACTFHVWLKTSKCRKAVKTPHVKKESALKRKDVLFLGSK